MQMAGDGSKPGSVTSAGSSRPLTSRSSLAEGDSQSSSGRICRGKVHLPRNQSTTVLSASLSLASSGGGDDGVVRKLRAEVDAQRAELAAARARIAELESRAEVAAGVSEVGSRGDVEAPDLAAGSPGGSALSASWLLSNPPDGVDLNFENRSSGPSVSADEVASMYHRAFEAAGGEPTVREFRDEVAKAVKRIKENNLPSQQMAVWQSYTFEDMQHFTTKGPMHEFASETLRALERDLQKNVDPRVSIDIAQPKGKSRAVVKARIKYADDYSRLCDLCRCTVDCPDLCSIYRCLLALCDRWGVNNQVQRVVELEDHYSEPMAGGYRHVQVLVLLGGSLWEVQLNTAAMLEAKHRCGHKLYKTTRFVKEMLLLCAMLGDVDTLKRLLDRPGVRAVANPNEVRDSNGLSALHHAAFRGDKDVLGMLLAGAQVSEPADPWALDRTSHGGLPLTYALRMQHWDLAEHLAEAMTARVGASEHALEKAVLACYAAAELAAPPTVLEAVARLWAALEESTQLASPLHHASGVAGGESLRVLLRKASQTTLWRVAPDGKLALEAALQSGLAGELAAAMAENKPELLPPKAVESLLRCRSEEPEVQTLISQAQKMNTKRIFSAAENKGKEDCLMVWDSVTLEAERALDTKDGWVYSLLNVGPSESYKGTANAHLFAGCGDGSILVYENGEAKTTLHGHKQLVKCLAWVPPDHNLTGSRAHGLWSGSYDCTILRWDVRQNKSVLTVKNGKSKVRAMCFSPAGSEPRFLCVCAGYAGEQIVLFDPFSGVKLQKVGMRGHAMQVKDLVPVGEKLLLSCSEDSSIRCWDLDTEEEVAALDAHQDKVFAIASEPDRNIFVSVSEGSICKWQLNVPERPDDPPSFGPPSVLATGGPFDRGFLRDGILVHNCGERKNELRLLNVESGAQLGEPFGRHGRWITAVCVGEW